MTIVTNNPYIPSFLRAAMIGSRPLVATWQTLADTNVLSSSSFQYDSAYKGLKSSQQLNVDWSQFQSHTFFMSAEAKVNLAFDQIINGFPFDGTRQETEVFFDNLTGFDKWVFDQFPTFHGELQFSGSQIDGIVPATGPTSVLGQSGGTYIVTQNKVGALFPELVNGDGNTGAQVLNPTGSQSLTIEMQLYLPPIANGFQTVCQMLDNTNVGSLGGSIQGFSLFLTQTPSTGSVGATFVVVSGSNYMTVPLTLQKGTFNHIALELNRDSGLPYLESYINSNLAGESDYQVEIGDLTINNANFLIGNGTPVQYGSTLFVPNQTLSGTIDEFRVFHSARSPQQQAAYASKALYATSDLVLYYRFNEPTGSLDTTQSTTSINSVALDSSGNSLHALISNFSFNLRMDATIDPLNPVSNERTDMCPVLFPAYPQVVSLNQSLLTSGSFYDQENPNLITRLVPQHYLLEGAQQDGYTDPVEGNDDQPYSGTGIPGQGKIGSVQIMVSLLYVYARFFDEMKMFIDAFSTLRTVDYDTNNVIAPDTVPDSFLINFVNSYGFYLPPLFSDADIEQYVRGENIEIDQYSTNNNTLRYVQNTLMRRVLKSLPSVLKSKGTQFSIGAFLRSVGIDPNNIMRLREVGGPTTQQLSFARENKIDHNAMITFSGDELVVSPFLSASRTEPGFPLPAGTPVYNKLGNMVGTTNKSDGLLTSGSWTWEGIVRFTPVSVEEMNGSVQSLARLCVTGSTAGSSLGSSGIVANLIAVSSSIQPRLGLYVRPGASATSPLLYMEVDTPSPNVYTGPLPLGMFNYDRWNVSFGCQRADDGLCSSVSSSYFLRLAYQNNGKIEWMQTTSSYFQECPNGEQNVFTTLGSVANANGTFIAMGADQPVSTGIGSGYLHLNNVLVAPEEAQTTAFNGRLSNVRFWSKALTETEWEEHVRNYNSVGVENPSSNWNYVTNVTGSWGRLRLNSMTKQDVRNADVNGKITFIDYSENCFHLTGSNFPQLQEAVSGEVFDLSFFSPYFDEATSNQKVRIRSFLDLDLVEQTPWASMAPVYEITPSERPTDDVRFIMEFSLVEALNRDIISIFGTLDALDNALGDGNLVFSPDYPELEVLRDVYFNRIKDKLNFEAFFEFFRWFDSSVGGFIQQLIPRKTIFKGVNFTIESHMLERHKMNYDAQSQIYLGDSNRTNLNAQILLQFIEGDIRKF
jgi:hypothetical protein